MFDIKWIRDNASAFDAGLARRGMAPRSPALLALDARRRQAQTTFQEAQSARNAASREIGQIKARGGDATAQIEAVSALKATARTAEEAARTAQAELDGRLAELPNLPAADVPDGADESANVTVRQVGEPPIFGFTPRQHFELGEALGMMDFAAAARLSGARFVVLSGALARLERALAAFMIDIHTTEFGYREFAMPVLVRDSALFGTGQLPKFRDDLFRTDNDYWLIPTAEVPLTNLVGDSILDDDSLPRRYCALSLCFRAEAGAAGKDTRGMIRQHQFQKVEMVSITRPEESAAELERMTAAAEEVLKRLDLAYRVVLLSTGDMGFAASKTYDLEVWLPGQECYREISSCSLCGDFQARRLEARYRPRAGGKGTRYVHTLNGSGLAVGRCLVAVLENGQRADGAIAIPPALQPYMGGLDVIAPDV